MKQISNILKIFIIFILLIGVAPKCVNADIGFMDVLTDGLWGAWLEDNADSKLDIDIEIGTTHGATSSNTMISRLLGVMQMIGSVVSVVALIIIGLRYMFSTLEEKANMKGVIIYYIVGAVLVFATSNILGIAYKIINGLGMN